MRVSGRRGREMGRKVTNLGWAMDNLRVVAFTAAVPEPTTYALMLAGLGCIGVAIRCRRSR